MRFLLVPTLLVALTLGGCHRWQPNAPLFLEVGDPDVAFRALRETAGINVVYSDRQARVVSVDLGGLKHHLTARVDARGTIHAQVRGRRVTCPHAKGCIADGAVRDRAKRFMRGVRDEVREQRAAVMRRGGGAARRVSRR